MKIPQLRVILILLVLGWFSLVSADTLQACGFGCCWACRHAAAHHARVHRAVTFSQAPVVYQMPMMAQTTAAAPQQGLTDAITITKVLLDFAGQIREGRGGDGDNGGSRETDSSSLAEIRSSLKRLSEGQEDLKGRLINNAGIGQSIGERLVQMDEKVDKVIGENTTAIKELTEAIKKLNQGGAEETPEKDPAELQSRLTKVEQEVKKLGDLDARIESKMNERFGEDNEKLKTLITAAVKEATNPPSGD